jgi:hypothetical protein
MERVARYAGGHIVQVYRRDGPYVRPEARFPFSTHMRSLVPASGVYWLADSSRFVSVHSSQVRRRGIYSRSREIGVTDQTSALRAMLFSGPP